jgi:Cu/Ag efflux protein CusF
MVASRCRLTFFALGAVAFAAGAQPGTIATYPAFAAAASGEFARHPASTGTRTAHSGHGYAQGTGTVNSVDAAARTINLTHDPIPAIGWPTMTTDFPVAPAVDLDALGPGARVRFEIEHAEGGMYVIRSIAPSPRPAGIGRR